MGWGQRRSSQWDDPSCTILEGSCLVALSKWNCVMDEKWRARNVVTIMVTESGEEGEEDAHG